MLNDFYTIKALEQGSSVLQCSIIFNAGHEIFAGHFPGQPVVPGVCTMHIAKALLEAALREKLLLIEAPVVKFLQLMIPGTIPDVTIRWDRLVTGFITANATFKVGDAAVFKMTGIYRFV